MIVLDTSVLSLALRRRRSTSREEPLAVAALRQLVQSDAPLAVPGVVYQELLSGVRSPDQFRRIQSALDGFPLLLARREDHVRAANVARECAEKGVRAGAVDYLIAAFALGRGRQLFTNDEDFTHIAAVTGIRLFRP